MPSFTASPEGSFEPTPDMSARLVLSVYNTSGLLVDTVYSGSAVDGAVGLEVSASLLKANGVDKLTLRSAGMTLHWDGRDASGRLLASGDYYVTAHVTRRDGSAVDMTRVVTLVGDSGGLLEGSKAYPNPARDHLWVDMGVFPSGSSVRIRLFNVAGELVRQLQATQARVEVPLASPSGAALADGIYLLTLEASGPGGVKARRIIHIAIAK